GNSNSWGGKRIRVFSFPDTYGNERSRNLLGGKTDRLESDRGTVSGTMPEISSDDLQTIRGLLEGIRDEAADIIDEKADPTETARDIDDDAVAALNILASLKERPG